MVIGRDWLLFAILMTVLFFSITCSKKSSTGPSDTSTEEIKTGAAVIYQVSSGGAVSVTDTVSGTIFLFPKGGSGTLSVAPVISGPEVGIPATRLVIQYTGSGEMAIAVPHTAGNEEIIYTFRKLPNVSVEGANAGDMAWLGVVPSEQRNDTTIFTLSSSAVVAGKRSQSGTASTTVAIATVTPNSEAMVRRQEALNRVTAAIQFWVKNLPPALKESAYTRINGENRCSITWSSDGNCYDHTTSTIYLQVDGNSENWATEHTCAHEVGHYMTHILAGFDRYVEILDRMPKTWYGAPVSHGLAEYFEFRKYVVEEYAFLSDFLITGTVDNNDLTKSNVSTMFGGSGPDLKDFPSFEGYGAIMFGALLRTKPEVISFWVKTTGVSKAPVVGAPIGDVLALTARGARDINELQTVIQEYLTARGYTDQDKLPAMLEPLGWSYHGSGKIVDTKGNAVANATVQSCTQNGSGEFRTPASKPTGADGKFILPRIFPGTNLLRVYSNSGKDSTTFGFTADSTLVTNAALDLGEITLRKIADIPSTKTTSFSMENDIMSGKVLMARVKTTVTFSITGYDIQPNDDVQTSTFTLAIGMPSSVKISATSSVETVKSVFEDADWKEVTSYSGSSVSVYATNYSSATLKESGGQNSYSAEFTFPVGYGGAINFETTVRVEGTRKTYNKGTLSYTLNADQAWHGPSVNLSPHQ